MAEEVRTHQVRCYALLAHSLFLVFIDHAVVVLIVRAQIHIRSGSQVFAHKEDGGIKAGYKQRHAGHLHLGIECLEAGKGLIQFLLHIADVLKEQLCAAVGIAKTIDGIVQELRQGFLQIGGVRGWNA